MWIFDATIKRVSAPLKGELARAERATEGSLTMCAHSGRGLPRRCSATLVYSAARNLRLRGDPAAQDDATLLSRYAGWRAFGAPTSFLSSLEKKETKQRKKPPTEINLPAFRGGRAFMARHRQIYNGRLYLPILSNRCNCFRVFTNA